VSALLREDCHQLFKRPCWLADLEVNLDSVTVDQVSCEGSVVEWIEPVPTLHALVIVRVHPSEAFAVRLPNPVRQVILLRYCLGKELLSVVALTPPENTKLHLVDVLLDHLVVFSIVLAL
jgi:hypothetical protein